MRRFMVIGVSFLALALAGGRALFSSEAAHADPNAPLQVMNTSPNSAVAGSTSLFLKVYGDGFPSDIGQAGQIHLLWNGQQLGASVKSSTEIQVQVPGYLLAVPGQVTLGAVHSNGQSVTMAGKFMIQASSGDTDCNNSTTASDALHVLRILAELETEDSCSADANKDGAVNMNDVFWIRQEIAGVVEPKAK